MDARSILLVGNFLSAARAHRHYCEDFATHLEANRWRVARTSVRNGRVGRLLDMLYVTWAQRNAYAVAHVDLFSGPAFVWAEAVCFELRRLGKPYVITLRGGNLPVFANRWPRRVKRLLSSAAVVTAPSAFLRDAMRAHGNIVVVPNAIDVSQYAFVVRAHPRPRMVWLRAFHAVYNPALAVDVLAAIARQYPDAMLTMIGPDRGDGSLSLVERRARALGVTDRLELVAGVPKPKVPAYLVDHDIFLNTTDVDNAPVSVLEAMACGLCVVSTAVGGIPQLLHDQEDALLVPAGDAAAMAAAVERLLADDSLAARVSAGAHVNALACDWGHVLNRWEQLLGDAKARS